MRLFTVLAAGVVAGAVSFSASAHESMPSAYKHGQAHHTHTDGNWHGQKPHMHDGVPMHRGHSHEHVHAKCPNLAWHDTADLQKWVAKYGSYPCYSDDMHQCRGYK